MVVIAPGPVSMGMAIGNIELLSLCAASESSSDVMLSRVVLANSMSRATRKSRIPPATLNECVVILKKFNMYSPDTANIMAIAHASATERFATYILSVSFILEVKEMKVMTPLMGLTIAK